MDLKQRAGLFGASFLHKTRDIAQDMHLAAN